MELDQGHPTSATECRGFINALLAVKCGPLWISGPFGATTKSNIILWLMRQRNTSTPLQGSQILQISQLLSPLVPQHHSSSFHQVREQDYCCRSCPSLWDMHLALMKMQNRERTLICSCFCYLHKIKDVSASSLVNLCLGLSQTCCGVAVSESWQPLQIKWMSWKPNSRNRLRRSRQSTGTRSTLPKHLLCRARETIRD